MTIIKTDKWLKKYIKDRKRNRYENLDLQREIFCEKLVPFFHQFTSHEIQEQLINHGFFVPTSADKQLMEEMIEKDFWKIAEQQFDELKKEWNGPDIPIFIFPANINNHSLRVDLNGKSGISFRDKLFLFFTPELSSKELKALLIHEYSHACRLQHLKNHEGSLLDSMIMEGIAEHAVKQLLGKKYLAKWTSIYSFDVACKHWKNLIKDNLKIKKTNPLHDDFMYGKGKFPKWLGYNAGFHLVSTSFQKGKFTLNELLKMPSDEIYLLSEFAVL